MKKMFLMAALMMGACGTAIAQTDNSEYTNWWHTSITNKTFNAPDYMVNIRDYVMLREGQMVLELGDADDFGHLKNFDSVVGLLWKDMAFYKDSLEHNDGGSVRIDYVLQYDGEYKKIRFEKHPPEGEIFIDRYGETSRLKLDQDTINITMRVKNDSPYHNNLYLSKYPHTLQVKFYLNNYTALEKIMQEREMLNHVMDTLASVQPKRTRKMPFFYTSSAIYRPFATDPKWRFVDVSKTRFLNMAGNSRNIRNRPGKFSVLVNFGMDVVGGNFAPDAEFGISYIDHYRGNSAPYNIYSFFTVFASSDFFFERNIGGSYLVRDNWFANAELGSTFNSDIYGLKIRGFSVGAGYLVLQKGDYFKGTTLKGFLNMPLRQGFTLSPELILTDNCKQVYPGITVKIFGKQ